MYLYKKIKDRIIIELKYLYLSCITKCIYNNRKSEGVLKNRPVSDFCDLAVVSFNNAKVIEYQIKTLRKFFVFPYRYTVFDNSNNNEISIEIKQICTENKVGYVKLPRQEFIHDFPSYSHGIACNYLFNKYIRNGGAKYFGLLDHDIFPVERFDISEHLEKQFFYGVRHLNHIWPGFWFMRMDSIKGKPVDFRPSYHLKGDTGVCNGPIFFKDIIWDKYEMIGDEKRCFAGYDDAYNYGYSYFTAGWIHCWNASNHMKKVDISFKMNSIFNILDERLSD